MESEVWVEISTPTWGQKLPGKQRNVTSAMDSIERGLTPTGWVPEMFYVILSFDMF